MEEQNYHMLSRRTILGLFAPRGEAAFQGQLDAGLCCASYQAKLRRTNLRFLVGGAWRYAFFDHDTSRVSRPERAGPEFPAVGAAPRIQLRVEDGELRAYETRGETRLLRGLMQVEKLSPVVVCYPNPVHPDFTAFWSIEDRLYFTNNDYRKVYRLPEVMADEWAKPGL